MNTLVFFCLFLSLAEGVTLILKQNEDRDHLLRSRTELQQEPDVLGTYVLESCSFKEGNTPFVTAFEDGFPRVQGIVTITSEWFHCSCLLQGENPANKLTGSMIAKWTLDGSVWNLDVQHLNANVGYFNETNGLYASGNAFLEMPMTKSVPVTLTESGALSVEMNDDMLDYQLQIGAGGFIETTKFSECTGRKVE